MPPDAPDTADLLRHASFLRSLVRGLVRDEASADDALQQTWLRTIESPPRHGRNLRGWLATVARNAALKLRRSDARRARREGAVGCAETTSSGAATGELLLWQRRVVEAVEALERPHRDVVVCRFYEDLGPRQIAARLGIPGRDVSKILEEALKRMRRHLDASAGGRRSGWALALLPLWDPRVGAGAATGASVATATGGVVMGTKAVVGLTVVVALAAFWAGWATKPEPAPAGTTERPVASVERGVEPRLEGAPSAPVVAAAPSPAPSPSVPAKAARTADEWLRLIEGARNMDEAFGIVAELRALPPDEGWEVMNAIYRRIDDVSRREWVAKAFQGSGHRHEIRVLDLAANDEDAERDRETREWLGRYAFRDFEEDAEGAEGYRRWADEHRGLSVPDAVEKSAREWVDRMRRLTGRDLVKEMRKGRDLLKNPPESVIPALRRSGLPELLEEWRRRTDLDPDVSRASFAWLAAVGGDAATTVALAKSIVENPEAHPAGVRKGAYQILGKEAPAGAVDLLLRAFETAPEKGDWWPITDALTQIGDPRALPVMVGMIVADDTEASVYWIGYFGLAKWLKVDYAATHDGAWWRQWWAEHQDQLPPEVRGTSIPVLSPRGR